MSLNGRVALITGAGRGLGSGVALNLAARGVSVVINYASSARAAENLVTEIEKRGGKAVAIQADVTKVADISKLFEAAVQHFGKLDIVINNAGMEAFFEPKEVTEEIYERIFALNTRAQFFVGQQALKHLEVGGRIIFMSSISASLAIANHALYAASKAAAEAFARSFAADGGPRRITSNAIAPGGIKTDMFEEHAWRYVPGGTSDMPVGVIETNMAKQIPLGRCAVPDDIARVVVLLCEPDSEWINGQVIRLTGGATNT